MTALDYEALRSEALALLAQNEPEYGPYLSRFLVASELCQRLGTGRSGGLGKRPQDHMAVALGVFAYRSAFAGAMVSMAGYPDVAPTVARPVFENALRLIDIEQDPVPGALGALLYSANEETSAIRADMAAWDATDLKGLEERARYLDGWTAHSNRIRARIKQDNIDEADALKRHGRLDFKKAAAAASSLEFYRDFFLKERYEIYYRRAANFAHGRSAPTFYTAVHHDGGLSGELGFLRPMREHVISGVQESLRDLGLVLLVASRVVEDQPLFHDAQAFEYALHRLIDG